MLPPISLHFAAKAQPAKQKQPAPKPEPEKGKTPAEAPSKPNTPPAKEPTPCPAKPGGFKIKKPEGKETDKTHQDKKEKKDDFKIDVPENVDDEAPAIDPDKEYKTC